MRPPTVRFPWVSADCQRNARQWQERYEQKSDAFATCHLLETMGSGIKAGRRPELDPQMRDGIIAMLREDGLVEKMKDAASDWSEQQPPKPWWDS
jgi:hypothetical protein